MTVSVGNVVNDESGGVVYSKIIFQETGKV
jgi:hypothetical protein